MNSAYSSAVTIIILVCISLIFSLICAQNGLQSDGLPVLFICVGIAIVTQWIIFVPSYLLQTEKYYDLTGIIVGEKRKAKNLDFSQRHQRLQKERS